jgi:hypothetical protein
MSGFRSTFVEESTARRADSGKYRDLAFPKLSLGLEPIVYVVAMFATTALVNLVRTTANRIVGNGCGRHFRSIFGHRMSISIRPAAFFLHGLAF